MSFLRTTLEQFQKFFGDLPPSQRLTVATAVLLVVGGLGYLVYRGAVPDEEALLAGKQFGAEELKVAQEALRAGGMTNFRVDAMKLYVPRTDAAAYNAALIAGDALPAHFNSELSNLHKNLNPLLSNQQRHEMIEVAKAEDLCRSFEAIPEVQDAKLVWNEARERGLYGGMRKTATLTLQPRGSRTISTQLAHSLRRAVANGLNMSVDNVSVLDTTGRIVHGPEQDDPSNWDYIERKRDFTERYQKQIEQLLEGRIPNAIVAVNVELDTLRHSREQTVQYTKPMALSTTESEESDDSTQGTPSRQPGVRPNTPADVTASGSAQTDRRLKKTLNTTENVPGEQTVKEKMYEPLPLKSVQATVAIPEDHFKKVALARGESEADAAKFQAAVKTIRDTTLLEVQQQVAALLPPPVAPAKPEDLVKVSTFDRVDQPAAAVEPPLTTALTDMALQYAGPAALCLFALWALFSLQRSLPKAPKETVAAPTASSPTAAPGQEVTEEGEPLPTKREVTPRDRLQTAVRDNPEMAAAVLERWIKPIR